jgi:hypothetical protein
MGPKSQWNGNGDGKEMIHLNYELLMTDAQILSCGNNNKAVQARM